MINTDQIEKNLSGLDRKKFQKEINSKKTESIYSKEFIGNGSSRD